MARGSWLRALSGKATKPSRRSERFYLEELESRLLPAFSQLALDFDTTTSPTAAGFTKVASPYYTTARGFGFKNSGQITAIDRGTADALTRDFHQGRNETFNADMMKGWYVVRSEEHTSELQSLA